MSLSSTPRRHGRRLPRGQIIRLLVLLVLLAGAFLVASRAGWLGSPAPELLRGALARVRSVPALPLWFVLVYIAATALALPAWVLTLAGGALFGTLLGTTLSWGGATLGATLAYLLGSTLGRGALHALLGHRAAALDRLSTRHGFRTLLRLRLLPIVPFNLLNYAAALAGVRPRDFVGATALGILPGTFVYTYFASALVAGVAGARTRAFLNVLTAGGLLVLLSFLPALGRRRGWWAGAGAAPHR